MRVQPLCAYSGERAEPRHCRLSDFPADRTTPSKSWNSYNILQPVIRRTTSSCVFGAAHLCGEAVSRDTQSSCSVKALNMNQPMRKTV